MSLIVNLFLFYPEIDHNEVLQSILIYMDSKRAKGGTIKPMKLRNFDMGKINPLLIYKELINKEELKMKPMILKSVLLAFCRLLKFENSPKIDIIFLNIFKKLIEKVLQQQDSKTLSLDLVKQICKDMILKFKGTKLEIKNVIMEILTMVLIPFFDSINLLESNAKESTDFFNNLCYELSQEINYFAETSFKDRKLILGIGGMGEESSLTLSELKKKSSIKSHFSDILTPSKKSSTPTAGLFSDKKFELKYTKMGPTKKFGAPKKFKLDMRNITPRADRVISVRRAPNSMKNADVKNFEFFKSKGKGTTSSKKLRQGTFEKRNAKMIDNSGLKKKAVEVVLPKKGRKAVKGFRGRRKEFLKKKKLTLDTDEINKLYNFGGEKGRKIVM